MKTLILYATKYGASREIAKRIAGNMDGAAVHDLKQNDIPALSNFDCVIIGSSLYAGMICKEAKIFLSKNAETLNGKKIGLFLSGMDMDADKQNEYFATNFPPTLLQTAKAKCTPGGIYDPKKAGFAERTLFKMIMKISTYLDTIDNKKIDRFAENMKQ